MGEGGLVEGRVGKGQGVTLLQHGADAVVVLADLLAEGAGGALGLARGGHGGVGVVQQVAVGGELLAGGHGQGALEGGVAAGVVAGVVVREAILHLGVVDGVVQQVGDAEVQAAATGEDFLPDAAGVAVGVGLALGVVFGIADGDLHGAAGAHGVVLAEQALAEGHGVDEVLEGAAEVFFGAGTVDALGVALAVAAGQGQCGADHEAGDVVAGGAFVDGLPGDGGQAGHHGIDLEARFLLDDGDGGAQAAAGGGQPQQREGGLDVGGPAAGVLHVGRNGLAGHGAGVFGGQSGLAGRGGLAAGQQQGGDQQYAGGNRAFHGIGVRLRVFPRGLAASNPQIMRILRILGRGERRFAQQPRFLCSIRQHENRHRFQVVRGRTGGQCRDGGGHEHCQPHQFPARLSGLPE